MLKIILIFTIIELVKAAALRCQPFTQNSEGQYTNGTCLNKLYDYYKDNYDYETYLMTSLPPTDLINFIDLVGYKLAGEALNLTGSYFHDAADIAEKYRGNNNVTHKRDTLLYTDEIPSWTVQDGSPGQFCRISQPLAWERCHLQNFYYKVNGFTLHLIEMCYGIRDKAPEAMKKLWSFSATSELCNALGLIGVGTAFLSTKAKKECSSTFIITDDKYNIVSAGGATDPVMLIGVIPRTKSTGNCDTRTKQQDIIDELVQGFRAAGSKAMSAFCLTITGASGWFGSNNWYGQVKVMSMKSSGSVSYAEIPCKEYISNNRWFNGDWYKKQYVGTEISL